MSPELAFVLSLALRMAVAAAFVITASIVTMPLTAAWLAVLAPLTFVTAALVALAQRDPTAKDHTTRAGFLLGGGLMVGPLIYVGLAAARALS